MQNNPKLFVILVTDRIDLMHKNVVSQCHLIKIDLPNYEYRLKFLENHLQAMDNFEIKVDKKTLELIARQSEGFSYFNLQNITVFAATSNYLEKTPRMIIESSTLINGFKKAKAQCLNSDEVSENNSSLQLLSNEYFKIGSSITVIILACSAFYKYS